MKIFAIEPVGVIGNIYDFLGDVQDDYVENYEKIHKYYGHKRETIETSIFRNICELIVPKVSESILDLGCGSSGILEKTNCQNKVELDVSYEALRNGPGGLSVIKVRAFAENMPFFSGFFDIILCLDLIEHVKDLDFVVSETHRVLKKGGTLLLACPWEQDLSVYDLGEYKEKFGKWKYVHLRTINEGVIRKYFLGLFELVNSTMITAGMRFMEFKPYPIKFMEFKKK